MRFRIVVAILSLSMALFVGATPLEAQFCAPINGSLKNDLCWMNRFAGGNYRLSPAQMDAFQVYSHGVNVDTVDATHAPWGGNYFSWARGGIAARWQGQVGEPAYPTLNSLRWASVQRMDSAQISRLSPSEKLDVLAGNRDFRITAHELRFRGPFASGIQSWEGFCNGIRAAGALVPEPQRAVRRVSAEGQIVVFEPTDIKALLGAAFFYLGENNNYAQIGENVGADPNAGAFDIALRMLLGGTGRVFFMDVNTSSQIWNHTVVGYERKLVHESALLHDGTRALRFETAVHHMGETSLEDMSGQTSTRVANLSSCCVQTDRYVYELVVDSNDRIVNGRWMEGFRPDALWFGSGIGDDSNHTPDSPQGPVLGYRGNPHIRYSVLAELLEASQGTAQ